MRNAHWALLLLTTTACSFQIGAGTQPPPNAPPPPQPGAAPPPPAPGGRGVSLGKRPRGVPSPAPAPAPAPGQPQAVGPSFLSADAVNVVALQSLRTRSPKACGLQQVNTGQWVTIDCHAYNGSTTAVPHLSPRKAQAVQSHRLLWKPPQEGGYTKSASNGGSTKSAAPTTAPAGVPGFPPGMPSGFPQGMPAVPGMPQGVPGMPGDVKADPTPGTVDHRTGNLEGPIKDQGAVGSCTAFSLSSTIDNAAIRAGKLAGNSGDGAASANHVWSGYGIPMMGTAADKTRDKTIATRAIWDGESQKEACKLASPQYGDECGNAYGVQPGTWQADPLLKGKVDKSNTSGAYKVTAIEQLQTLPPNLEEIVTSLASGSDLWVAFKLDGTAWSTAKIRANGNVIPDWTTSQGGHAVTLSGYRDAPSGGGKQFLIHNSWGTSWGDGGYAWVSEAMVKQFMHYAYRVKLSDPVLPGKATDDDCAPDQFIDIFTGKCAAPCSAPSSPAAPADPNNPMSWLRPANGCPAK